MAEQTTRMGWPYPSENQDPYFDALEAFFSAADVSSYASRENDNVILTEGGTISFNSTSGVVDWTSNISILSAIAGFNWTLEIGQFTLDDGQLAYLTLNRSPTQNTVVTATVASQVPSTNNTLVFAVRRGDYVYFRNGAAVQGGTSISPIGGGGGGGGGVHAGTHVAGSSDIIDGDVLDITYTPTNYTRTTVPAEVTVVAELTAHLAGIDNALAGAGGGGTEITLTNASGGAMTQGQVVYINGSGTFAASATTSLALATSIGFVNEASIADTVAGTILTGGPITIPTGLQLGGAWLAGETIYLSATPGSLTRTVPVAPTFETIVGTCTNTPGGADAIVAIQIEPPLQLTTTTLQQVIKDVPLSAETALTSFQHVTSIYLEAGTLESTSLAFLGTLAAGDTAELQLIRETGAVLIATWDVVASVPVSDALGSSPAIPADDWYNLRLRSVGGLDTARVQGVRLVITS
jgi:hypothetical protein